VDGTYVNGLEGLAGIIPYLYDAGQRGHVIDSEASYLLSVT